MCGSMLAKRNHWGATYAVEKRGPAWPLPHPLGYNRGATILLSPDYCRAKAMAAMQPMTHPPKDT